MPGSGNARRPWWALAVIAAGVLAAFRTAPAAEVLVTVDAVESGHGHVLVAVCTPTTFLGPDCPYNAKAPAEPGAVEVVVREVPPGTYAVQVFHDKNDNFDVDRGLFGLPTEGVGFSNDAPIRFGPPKFDAAAIRVEGERAAARVTLRHFGG